MAGEEPKLDLSALAIGVAAVGTVLAALGVSGDLLLKTIRNKPYFVLSVLLAIASAAAAAIAASNPRETIVVVFRRRLGRRHFRAVAVVLLAIALMIASAAATRSVGEREPPQVSIALKSGDESHPLTLEAKAAGLDLRAKESMRLTVMGVKSPTTPDSLRSICWHPGAADPNEATLLFWNETGPNSKGEATSDLSIDAPEGFSFFCAYAALVLRKGEDRPRTNWAAIRSPETTIEMTRRTATKLPSTGR